VLQAMTGVVPNLYLFGPQRAAAACGVHLTTWKDVARELL
jgi:hypothetical protein